MNIGYFTSFTAFLALNDADFCNNYLRQTAQPQGILPLAGYLQFWGWFFAVVTALIALCKHETNFQPAGEIAGMSTQCVWLSVFVGFMTCVLVVINIVTSAVVMVCTLPVALQVLMSLTV